MRSALFALATTFTLLVLLPAMPDAGRLGNEEPLCSKPTVHNGETIHGCFGTMRAFRNSADPDAFAELLVRGNGQVSFQARLNGVYLSCFFEDSYDTQYFAATLASVQNARFVVGSRDGVCDSVGATVAIGSRYGEY